MKLRKLLALVLTLLLTIGLFAGCGAATYDSANGAPSAMAPADNASSDKLDMEADLSDSGDSVQTSLPENMKIITTVYMDAETETLDATLSGIDARVNELGGYIEAQEIYNGSAYSSHRAYRHTSMTIRVPADKTNLFVTHVSETANIVNKNITTENVTLTYVAIESRITALEVEQERLLELLGKAETMDDLLTIEARLTDVRYELEQVSSQLRLMDNKIDYSTIHLSLTEVKEFTETEEPETFGERVTSGFSNSMKNLWNGVVEVTIFLITRLPYFIPIGIIAVVVILIAKLAKGKKKKKEPPTKQENMPE